MPAHNKPPPSHFSILYFASASTFTKRSSEDFPAPLPVKELFGFLEAKHPGMEKQVLGSCAVTVNLEYVDVEADGEMVIREGDEVGIIPPGEMRYAWVGAGMKYLQRTGIEREARITEQ